MMSQKKDKMLMDIAIGISMQSKCKSRQVGAIIVKDGRVISSGYNGSLPGAIECHQVIDFTREGCKQQHREWSAINEVHAEMNAIAYAARSGNSTEGATMYSNLQPCCDCLKNSIAAGIKEFVYLEAYDKISSEEFIDYIKEIGIIYRKIEQ